MNAQSKHRLIVVASILFALLGATGVLMVSGLVFDKSYMMTQDALGEPGAALQLRIFFALCLVITVFGVTVLFKTVGKLRKK